MKGIEMCLSLPGIVRELKAPMALVEIAGVCRWYNALMHPDVEVGDRVLVHAGLILEVLEAEVAQEMDALLEEIGELEAMGDAD